MSPPLPLLRAQRLGGLPRARAGAGSRGSPARHLAPGAGRKQPDRNPERSLRRAVVLTGAGAGRQPDTGPSGAGGPSDGGSSRRPVRSLFLLCVSAGLLFPLVPGEAGSEWEPAGASPRRLLGGPVCAQAAATGAQRLASSVHIQVRLTPIRAGENSKDRCSPASVPTSSFEYLDNVEKLDLSHNRLASVGPGVFRGLSRLRQLYLHGNRLSAVLRGSLDMLPGLEVEMRARPAGRRSAGKRV